MKRTRIIFYISLFIWIALSISILIYILTQLDNIDEYNLYVQSGVNFNKLKDFCYNATEDQKNQYYTYFNNLVAYPPLFATAENIKQINALSKIAFIHLFNWIWLWILIGLDVFFLILTIYLVFILIKNNKKFKENANEIQNNLTNNKIGKITEIDSSQTVKTN